MDDDELDTMSGLAGGVGVVLGIFLWGVIALHIFLLFWLL